MGYNLLINGVYWSYNPLIRSPLILTTSCPGHPFAVFISRQKSPSRGPHISISTASGSPKPSRSCFANGEKQVWHGAIDRPFRWLASKPMLVGGLFPNPFWKICASQIGFIFPKFRGEHEKYLKPPPRMFFLCQKVSYNPQDSKNKSLWFCWYSNDAINSSVFTSFNHPQMD